jgi:uroporphyrinogen decarboxylase
MISRQERLLAAIAGEIADRPPVALWRHFPVDDQDPFHLAEATHAFQAAFDFDFIKVSPSSSFCLRDWGVEDRWCGNPEGTREYTHHVIEEASDWRSLIALKPETGRLADQLEVLHLLGEKVGQEIPYIQTIFSPLAQAKNLAGQERLFVHIRRDAQDVLAGLEIIANSTIAFIEQAKKRGIAGIFYAIQHGSYRYFDREGYRRFGEPFDNRVMEAASDLWLNVLHLHGEDLFFDLAEHYPVQVVNWHDRETWPDLATGKKRLKAAVCGGMSRWETLVLGTPDAVRKEAIQAMHALDGGRGWILGTGCVVPVIAPYGNLMATRGAVESG